MKKLLLLQTFFFALMASYGQTTCTANFGFTIDTNNVVTIIDSSTSSSCTLYFNYDYGDPQSSIFNTGNLNNSQGLKHFYRNAGTYTICQRVFTYSPCPNICYDTICKEITIPNSGSGCQAAYSYTSNGLSYTFTNSSSADDSIDSVLWDIGDGSPYYWNFDSLNHTFFFPGNYIVCLYIETNNGCQSYTCDTIMVNPSGLNEYVTNNSLTVSPNPFSTETTLHTDKAFKNATLTVYDLYGQQVKQIKNISGQATTLHRDNLPSGLYFICLTQDNKTFSADKLIITDN